MQRILLTILTPVPGRPGLCAWRAAFLDELGLTRRAGGETGTGLPGDEAAAWQELVA